MANRPVFVSDEKSPFFRVRNVEFEWSGGFAKTQKQKNIYAIHEAFRRKDPGKNVLEISSKSMQEEGEKLSAFFLKKYVSGLDKKIPVECVFQAGKVFENGGPYLDLLEKTPREAKRDERLRTSGQLVRFEFEGKSYPLIPKTIFYDFLYINALLETPELADAVLKYDAFTDVEFNPEKSINCQAKAAATFVSLSRLGLIDKVRKFEDFASLYSFPAETVQDNKGVCDKKIEKKEKAQIAPLITLGTVLKHKSFGVGEVVEVQGTTMKVIFPEVGEKRLGIEWCLKNCEFLNELRKKDKS